MKEKIYVMFAFMLILIGTASGARLPTIGGDTGNWGTILNQYLNVSLDQNGTIKTGTITAVMLDLADITLIDFIDDVGYLTGYTETDPVYTAWDKSTGISIIENQIIDLVHTVNTDTQLSEAQVDAFCANNGYAASGANTDITSLGPITINGEIIAYNDQATGFRLKGVCDANAYTGDDDVFGAECQSYSGVFYNTVYDDTGSSKARTTRVVYGSNEGMDIEIQGSNDVRITAVDNNNLGAEVRIASSGDVKIHADVSGAETDNLMATFNSGGAKLEVGGSANKVVCWKSDGKTLGYCSNQPDVNGACTCN